MNLGDPELEVIDPTPNVHSLFLHFDQTFFSTKLASRAVVRWSKRMYSCAGICSYEGRGGLCDIALSEPLLKLRSRKNLVETLIHEMIHAYLFITGNDRDRDGHGPNFQSHMHRINKAAGLNISIYHDFHDEVRLYQTHWWRCDGPCQHRKPYFGIVRRSANRAPGPNDFWWEDHKKQCGGTFIKTKEPDKKGKKATPKEIIKPMGDITKYVNNGNKSITGKVLTKSNSTGTVVITKPGVIFNPKPVQKTMMDTKGFVLNENAVTSNDNVAETVRNKWLQKETDLTVNRVNDITEKVREIWANKVLESKPTHSNKKPVKRAITTTNSPSPPTKIKKIDTYFKKAADLLKDVYGDNYTIQQKDKTSKLVAVKDPEVQIIMESSITDRVDCPICNCKVETSKINCHIDECLNKEEIEKVRREQPSCSRDSINTLQTVIKHETVDLYKTKEKTLNNNNVIEPESKVFRVDTDKESISEFIAKGEPSTSQVKTEKSEQICSCCGKVTNKPMDEHLDECLAFFNNNSTEPEEGNSFSDIPTIVIDDDDDDDVMDESQTFNATGTKTPCPVCLVMVEADDMNDHLDQCLME